MRTKEKLTKALIEANAPTVMIEKAERGRYDDFESTSETPIRDLVEDCRCCSRNHALQLVAERAIKGEFDATKEESEEWARRMETEDPEVYTIMKKMGMAPPKKKE